MLADPNDDIEIAGPTPAQPGVALPRDPNALPIAGSGLDADLQWSGTLDAAFAMADRAGGNILARRMASRAGNVELHPAARLFDCPLAMTLRAFPRSFDKSIPVAVSADIAPRDIQLHHPATDRRPERHVDLVLKIAARLRPFVDGLAAPAATENAGEDIAEPAAPAARSLTPASARAFKQSGKIKAAEINVAWPTRPAASSRESAAKVAWPGPRLSAATRIGLRRGRIDIVRVEPKLVVNLPFLRIAQDVVSLGKSVKLFFLSFVARIDVNLIHARKFAKRLADVVVGGGLLYPENAVIVFIFGLGGHG